MSRWWVPAKTSVESCGCPRMSIRCSSRRRESTRGNSRTTMAGVSVNCGRRLSDLAQGRAACLDQTPCRPRKSGEPSDGNRIVSCPTPAETRTTWSIRALSPSWPPPRRPTHLQIPTEHSVLPYAVTDAHDAYAIGEHAELHRSPAIRLARRRALNWLASVSTTSTRSTSAPAFRRRFRSAAELEVPLDDGSRPLTVTGGLTFAGSPWNNYVTHSIATIAERLAGNPVSAV